MSATKRLDFDSPHDGKRGPNGCRLCRQCGNECSNKRLSYCSGACRDAWYLDRFPGVQRDHVWERDQGICQLCRLDVKKLEAGAKRLMRTIKRISWEPDKHHLMRAKRAGLRLQAILRKQVPSFAFSWSLHLPHLWEMDHAVPLVEGGSNRVENLRVLCRACHRAETKALAGRLAAKRKEAANG